MHARTVMGAAQGVVMELQDCAFPLLRGIVATDNVEKGFEDISFALLVGSKPRGPGMERGDLLKDNGAIFTAQVPGTLHPSNSAAHSRSGDLSNWGTLATDLTHTRLQQQDDHSFYGSLYY